MKFGQNLPRNQVPEWAASYIDYKALKKLIKAATKNAEEHDGEEPDLAGTVSESTGTLDNLTILQSSSTLLIAS